MRNASARVRGIDWDQERERYVTGTESFADLAKRLGVSTKAVEQHAARVNLGQTWGESRAKYRSERDANVRKNVGENQAELLKQINVRRVQVGLAALDRIAAIVDGDLKVRELVDIAKLGIDQKLEISAGVETTELEAPVTTENRARLRPFLEAAMGRPLSTMTPENQAVLREFIDSALTAHATEQPSETRSQGDP